MFLPGESFYRAAVEQDPTLLDVGNRRVILASPTILITLLKIDLRGLARGEGRRERRRGQRARPRALRARSRCSPTTSRRSASGSTAPCRRTTSPSARSSAACSRRRAASLDHGVTVSRELPSPPPVERSAQPPQTAELPPRAPTPPSSVAAGEPGQRGRHVVVHPVAVARRRARTSRSGACAARYSPCERGTSTSSSPCQSRTSRLHAREVERPRARRTRGRRRPSRARPGAPPRPCSRAITARTSGVARCRLSTSGTSFVISSITPRGSRAMPVGERLEQRRGRGLARARRGHLLHVDSAMPASGSNSGIVERRHAAAHRNPQDAVAEQRAAGDRVRAAAGDAEHREPLQAERVRDRGDVRGRRGDRAPRVGVEPP